MISVNLGSDIWKANFVHPNPNALALRQSHSVTATYTTRTEIYWHTDGLVLDCSISSTLAMEILPSCTKPLIRSFNRLRYLEYIDRVLEFQVHQARQGDLPDYPLISHVSPPAPGAAENRIITLVIWTHCITDHSFYSLFTASLWQIVTTTFIIKQQTTFL